NSAKVVPVIGQIQITGDDPAARMLNRYLPAWVISSVIHFVVIGALTILLSGPTQMDGKTNDQLVTQVDDPNDREEPLTNVALGFDPDWMLATEAKKEAEANVFAPNNDDPPGLPNASNDIASDAAKM